MSYFNKEDFKEWMLEEDDKTANTVNNYVYAVDKISLHYSKETGQDVDFYKLNDVALIQKIAKDYSIDGRFSEFGYENHGANRNAIAAFSRFVTDVSKAQDKESLVNLKSVKEVFYNGYVIRKLENNSIKIIKDDVYLSPVKPILRELAGELNVNLYNGNRYSTKYNTQQLGDRIIKAIRLVDNNEFNINLIKNKKASIGLGCSLNVILYGSPGTGKTYETINKALEILDEDFLRENKERFELKERFDDFLAEGKIAFTTFHQSFSYEDFIEGIRANVVDGNVEYKVEDGVFKKIADAASLKNKSNSDKLYEEFCNDIKKNGLSLKTTSEKKSFDVEISNREDLLIIPQGDRKNSVLITKENFCKSFVEDKQIYEHVYARSIKKHIKDSLGEEKSNYVLIIDEINRGNIANIFGELITLIEPSKRAGKSEALSVTLPYSKETFSVPDNLYIIGTMNTADRSLALMDTALRRRFHFIEMMPQPELLADIKVEGVDIQRLLERMNARITALYDREHTLGHAFFIPLHGEPTLTKLREIFERQILPLLQEYFFEDWNKIRLVVGKTLVIEETVAIDLFDEAVDGMVNPKTYRLNLPALDQAATYIRIYDKAAKVDA